MTSLMSELDSLEERLGYRFEKPELLRRALTQPSAQGADGVTQEEIEYAKHLSWLGDSVLDMVISDKLFTLFPSATVEKLHSWSASLTNDQNLGRVAKELGLEESMTIGPSLQRNLEAKDRHIMLAGALEAILGAIYLEGGIQRVQVAVGRIFAGDFRKLLEHAGKPGT